MRPSRACRPWKSRPISPCRSWTGSRRRPNPRRAGWPPSPLVTCLLGFYLLTGQDLSEVLVAFSRSLGSGFGRLLPLLAKLWKLGDIFLRLTTDLALTLGKGLGFVSDLLGPGLLGLVLCLGVLITLLLLYGARRLLSLGERP
jgi:hypothetical protein